MNPRIALLLLAVAHLGGGRAEARAQAPPAEVTLEQAMALFSEHSPELRIARSQLTGSLGAARQGRAVPNLTAAFTHEDLGEYSESYLLLSQRLEFLWEQGRKGDRAEAWTAAAIARFDADSVRLATGVKRAFVDAWARAQAVETLERAESVVGEIIASAEARVAEGDLAGYDLRRLSWEHARMARRLSVAELELEDAERVLASSVSESDVLLRVGAADLDPDGPPPISDTDAVGGALANRAELRAARETVRALEGDASLAGSSWLAGTSVTGGGKSQSDGLNGWFLGLQVPFPLTDRRGGAKDAAQAMVSGAHAESALLTRIIAREVSLAEARLASLRRQRALLGADAVGGADALLRIARLSYEEGEVGIVELLDATRAFVEARLLNSQVQADSWIAYFELEAAVGGFPTPPTGE
jgi:cobalt-zinc-cadmium efflux system outer membrane protein